MAINVSQFFSNNSCHSFSSYLLIPSVFALVLASRFSHLYLVRTRACARCPLMRFTRRCKHSSANELETEHPHLKATYINTHILHRRISVLCMCANEFGAKTLRLQESYRIVRIYSRMQAN